jgi:anti-sigma factor RsiW
MDEGRPGLMRQNQTDDELLRSYLLGELPEPEADRLEQRLLAEDELFDLMEALEAELLAASSRGELAPAERERVLRRLASSPQGRERLALAKALNTAADGLSKKAPAPILPFRPRAAAPKEVFQWAALAAAGLLMVAGFSWFSRQTPQAGSSGPVAVHERPAPASPVAPAPQEKPAPPASSSAQTLREPQRAPERVAEKQEAPAKRSEPVKAVFALSLMTLRGAEDIEEFHLPSGTDIAELQIDLEGVEASGSFHAAVRSKDKGTIWEKSGLKSRQLDWGTALVLDVPAGLLTPGKYEVAIKAGTEAEEMTKEFKVVSGHG